MEQPYYQLLRHYEQCLATFGDCARGVDWPDEESARVRYRVMAELWRSRLSERVTVLDFGCGASHFREYCRDVEYSGLDLSEAFLDLSRRKYPGVTYYHLDVLEDPGRLPEFDYVVLNGLFTEKRELSHGEMWDFFRRLLLALYPKARRGLAFNVMSSHVDWGRSDLFHLPFDDTAAFVREHLTRHFVFRQDYGLHEYTVYLYREPSR